MNNDLHATRLANIAADLEKAAAYLRRSAGSNDKSVQLNYARLANNILTRTRKNDGVTEIISELSR